MLTLLLLIPLIGTILLIPINEDSANSKKILKNIALSSSLLNLIISYYIKI